LTARFEICPSLSVQLSSRPAEDDQRYYAFRLNAQAQLTSRNSKQFLSRKHASSDDAVVSRDTSVDVLWNCNISQHVLSSLSPGN